jgi:alanyl-tRNA synthetase
MQNMRTSDIREKYRKFFEERGHAIIPSASIMPENDPTTLFTGSGMQPMISYLLGEPHPKGTRIVDSQKSFRSQDIEEVGDNRHTTFFEMLGNWSLGDYFKREQIQWIFEFMTSEIGLDPSRIFVTVFSGSPDINIPKDEESANIWREVFENIGIEARIIEDAEKNGMQEGRIFYYGEDKNWWSRVGKPQNMPEGEPGGPDSEMFWDFGVELGLHNKSVFKDKVCHVNCDCGRFFEICNSVFMEFVKTKDGFVPLSKKNVDFGGGLERIVSAANDTPDVFQIDALQPIVHAVEEASGERYGDGEDNIKKARFQIIADHIRASVFIMSDPRGIIPSNTDQGYVVRRLIRRALLHGRQLGIKGEAWTGDVARAVERVYGNEYPELSENLEQITEALLNEESKFTITIDRGIRKIEKLVSEGGGYFSKKEKGYEVQHGCRNEDLARVLFDIYQTDGFPLELTLEELSRLGVKGVSETELKRLFNEYLIKHQDISRQASSKKFAGGLEDNSQETTRLHTATHLLGEALRVIISSDIRQKGSNITKERLRFDFNFTRKLTDEEVDQVEKLVNEKIKESLQVKREEMGLEEAISSGAQSEFGAQYPDRVSVYSIGDFSREICGGPHIENTSSIGEFEITKQEAVSAGVRRIRAVVK